MSDIFDVASANLLDVDLPSPGWGGCVSVICWCGIGISKKYFRPGGMAPSEWTRSVRAVRDTPVEDYSARGLNTTRRVANRTPIVVSPFLHALSVSNFERTLLR